MMKWSLIKNKLGHVVTCSRVIHEMNFGCLLWTQSDCWHRNTKTHYSHKCWRHLWTWLHCRPCVMTRGWGSWAWHCSHSGRKRWYPEEKQKMGYSKTSNGIFQYDDFYTHAIFCQMQLLPPAAFTALTYSAASSMQLKCVNVLTC